MKMTQQAPTNGTHVPQERLLPHNIEAELAVLDSIAIDPAALPMVVDLLEPRDFYGSGHAPIYAAMLALHNREEVVDTVTLMDELERTGDWHGVSDIVYALGLHVPNSGSVLHYARIVRRCARNRALIAAAGKIAKLAYHDTDDDATCDLAMREILAVMQRGSTSGQTRTKSFAEVVDEMAADVLARLDANEPIGMPTGFAELDKRVVSLEPGDLVYLAGRPGSGKCLAGHTLIDDVLTGARMPVEEFVRVQRPAILNVSERGELHVARVSDWLDSGVKPCFRVRTRNGRAIDVTAKHPFLTVHGWRKLSELAVGDGIAVPALLPVFGHDDSMPTSLVRLLAYYIAEGSCSKTSPGFTNVDPLIVQDFCAAIAADFPELKVRVERGITYYATRTRGPGQAIMPPNPMTEWLTSHGVYGKKAQEKCFPTCVWTWPRSHLAEFLKALMSCDGSIYVKQGRPYIEFTVSSERLAQDVHHAFLRFGIISKLYQATPNAWRVSVEEAASVQRYQESIGWIGEKATRCTNHVWKIERRLSNVGHVPAEIWPILKRAAQAKGYSLNRLAYEADETVRIGHGAGYNAHTGRTLPRYRLAGYSALLNDDHLSRCASPSLYWDVISTIEPIGEHRVYDLTVPGGQNFIAQDIVVHNSALGLKIALMAALHCHTRGAGTVDVVTLEMSAKQQARRLVADYAEINTRYIRAGFRPAGQVGGDPDMDAWAAFDEMHTWLKERVGDRLYLTEGVVSLSYLRSLIQRAVTERQCRLVVIDQLDLFADGQDRDEYERITKMSRQLKQIARSCGVVIICLVQLNRNCEARRNKRPMLSDLRQSGQLEQDADMVWGLFRPVYYDPERGNEESPDFDAQFAQLAELLLLKGRDSGSGAMVALRFEAEYTRFRDWPFADIPEDPTRSGAE